MKKKIVKSAIEDKVFEETVSNNSKGILEYMMLLSI